MGQLRRYYKGDFTLDITFTTEQNGTKVEAPVPNHVKIDYYTDDQWKPYTVERNGNVCTNCKVSDKKLVAHLSLAEHPIGVGLLRYIITEYTQDASYPGGTRKKVTPGQTDIILWTGRDSEDMGGIEHGTAGSVVLIEDIVDNLYTNTPSQPLSAAQGKKLNDNKVDKIYGKGLSTNDYTAADKAVVDRLRTFDPENISVEGGASVLVETTYLELRDKRDAGLLTPGVFYRITDYETITTQANTRSAGHPFDIIVQALDESTLSEDAYAIQRDGDEYFANAKLEGWKLKYTIDNDTTRFSWAKEEVLETPAKWSCSWGVLETKNSADASSNYKVVTVDGAKKYLYRPAQPTSFLEGKQFFKREILSSITSTEGFIYEADNAPYFEQWGEEEGDGEWYWSEVYTIYVKDANGNIVAELSNWADVEFYDYEYDEMGEYIIGFNPQTVYNEETGMYRFTPSYGVEEWFENARGGQIQQKGKVFFNGSVNSLSYAMDAPLPKYGAYVYKVYSSEDNHLYEYEEYEGEGETNIDYVSYQSYKAPEESGKGVIYRMIDEYNNDCPFDFKNIQFKHSNVWYYPFSYKGNDFSLSDYCSGNYIEPIRKVIVDNVSTVVVIPRVIFNLIDNPSTNKFQNGIVNNVFRVPIESGFLQAYRINSNIWEPSIGGSAGAVAEFYCYVSRQIYGNRFYGGGKYMRIGTSSSPMTNFYGNYIQLYVVLSGALNIYCSSFKCSEYKAILGGGSDRTISGGDITSCIIDDDYESSSTQNITFDASLCISYSRIRLSEALTLKYANTTSSTSPLRHLDIDARGWGSTTITIPDTFKTNAGYELKIAKNSSGVIKMWCDADLVQ